MNSIDVTMTMWYPLPAPADRFVLVRFVDEGRYESEVAFSIDGVHFLGDTEQPFHADINAWAYLPYDY